MVNPNTQAAIEAAQPEEGSSVAALELEPLLYVPAPKATGLRPRLYTPIEALYELTCGFYEAFNDAQWSAARASYYLKCGPRFSDVKELADFQAELEEANETMARLQWWYEATTFGAPAAEWRARTNELQLLLDVETDNLFEGITVAAMLDALNDEADEVKA